MGMKKVETLFSIITSILALAYTVAGVFMMTPQVSTTLHKKLLREFEDFAKVHPAVHFGYAINASKFMLQIGAIEVVCGLLILIGPKMTRVLSCLVLSSLTVGGTYFMMQLKRPFEYQVIGAVVLLLFLIQVNLLTTKAKTTEKEAKLSEKKVAEKKAKEEIKDLVAKKTEKAKTE